MSLLFTGACAPVKEKAPDDSDRLYDRTLSLADDYIDSLRLASDSMTLYRVYNHFNSALDSLNMTVAPNTDLLLDEGENDTIYMTITEVRDLFEQRLQELADTAANYMADPSEEF